MVKRLWFYIVCWKHRNTPFYELADQYSLVLKAARRCAYDLKHAGSDLELYAKHTDGGKIGNDYWERSKMWLGIFSPTGGKDYRHRMHVEIMTLELEVVRLKRLCMDNGVNSEDINKVPF